MTDRKSIKYHKLAYEILGLIGISALFAGILLLILVWSGGAVVQSYCFHNDIVMTESNWLEADRWIWSVSGVLSAVGFSVLFLVLFSEHMAYIHTITEGIHALRLGTFQAPLPLVGRNELTDLADSINFMSHSQRQLREKELSLSREKEQFIRTLSHDIRTPLTSVLAYSEYLISENGIPEEEQKEHLQTIHKKAEQIRDLMALLLEGDKRNLEYFDDAKLLIEQLVGEFEEDVEDKVNLCVDLSGCHSFAGTFDVQELRRIFDNLSSNVQKYADCQQPVYLKIWLDNMKLCIRQTNGIPINPGQKDSYKLGINSIRRIAQNYGGRVDVAQAAENFSITVTLSDF